MPRPVQRVFSFLRSGMSANHSVRSSFAVFSRRTMASAAPHASHSNYGSDTPWMIGSALIFGPMMLYLASPSARKTTHTHESQQSHSVHRSDASHHVEPQPAAETPAMQDDEGTEVSGEEIKQSMEQAFNADSPKDAREHEEAVAQEEETSVESSETVSQESANPAPSEADSAASEGKQEVEVVQLDSPANTEASQEAAEEKHQVQNLS